MPKRKHSEEEEHGGNHERWLLTYSDMITLLLVLFIVMYTISNVDAKKFYVISRGLIEVFSGSGSKFIGEGNSINDSSGMNEGLSPLYQEAIKNAAKPTTPPSEEQSPGSVAVYQKVPAENFEKVYKEIKEVIEEKKLSDDIIIVENENSILIKFAEAVLFYPNSNQIRKEALPILQSITDVLANVQDDIEHIRIEGHTADVGVDNLSSFYSWQLSSERGLAVLKFFSLQGHLPQERMSIEAFSHYKPAAENDSSEGMAKNRRVEILITRYETPEELSAVQTPAPTNPL